MNSSQQAYAEWVDRVKLRESIEAELTNALSMRSWRRVREIRGWLAEARQDVEEAHTVYKKLKYAEAHPEQGVVLM